MHLARPRHHGTRGGWIGPVTTWSRALAPVDVMLLHAKTRASNVFHPELIQLPSIARLPTVDASVRRVRIARGEEFFPETFGIL